MCNGFISFCVFDTSICPNYIIVQTGHAIYTGNCENFISILEVILVLKYTVFTYLLAALDCKPHEMVLKMYCKPH